jgi:hypothetical protein
MGGVLASCGLKALRCWNLTDYATREAQALSVGFESQTRIRIARAVRNAAIVQTSHLQRILRVGYALSALSDTPKRTPKNLWLLLEVLGSPWRIGGCESSLETESSGVTGCLWTSLEVPGRPQMAPRAGFQIARKLLSERVAQTSNELDTPSDTPRIHALRSASDRRCEGCHSNLQRPAISSIGMAAASTDSALWFRHAR